MKFFLFFFSAFVVPLLSLCLFLYLSFCYFIIHNATTFIMILMQRSVALQCLRLTCNTILLFSCLNYLWRSSALNHRQHQSTLSNYLFSPTSINTPYRISVIFIGFSFLAGIVLRIVMAFTVITLDRIIRHSRSAIVSLVYGFLSAIVVGFILNQLGSLISALQLVSPNSPPEQDNLKFIIFICTALSLIQSLFITDLIYSLPLLLRLHSIECQGPLLLIDAGDESDGSLGEAFSKLSLSTKFESKVSLCGTCQTESSYGSLLFGFFVHDTLEYNQIRDEPDQNITSQEMQIVHASCAAWYCLFNQGSNPQFSLPIDDLDGRKIFIWIYIAFLSFIVHTYISFTSFWSYLISKHRFISSDHYDSIQHNQQPLLNV